MEEVNSILQMDHYMKVIGNLIKQTEKEDLYTLMVIHMKVNGKIIKLMVLEYIIVMMDHVMKENG